MMRRPIGMLVWKGRGRKKITCGPELVFFEGGPTGEELFVWI